MSNEIRSKIGKDNDGNLYASILLESEGDNPFSSMRIYVSSNGKIDYDDFVIIDADFEISMKGEAMYLHIDDLERLMERIRMVRAKMAMMAVSEHSGRLPEEV